MTNDLTVKTVNFMGDGLLAAKDNAGIIWTGINSFCRGLGLEKHQRDRQIANIQSDEVLKRGCFKFEAGVFDQNNETLALQLDYVPLWLAKISITPAMKQNHPELVEKLIQYQLKAKDILAAAFLPQSYHQEMRQESKRTRKAATDSIKEFVAYAREQGSQHADRYYCSFTKLANKAAGITCSDEASPNQLNQLTLIEHILAEAIQENMKQGKPYKEIYIACKIRIGQFKEIAYLTNEKPLPEPTTLIRASNPLT